MKTRFEIEPDYAEALSAVGLDDFDAMMRAQGGEPTSKHRHRETVPIELDVGGRRQRFFLKRVFKVPGQHAWRPWMRGRAGYSQPAREWAVIAEMRAAGLPVMTRVAMGERRRWGVPTQAFILVEDVGMQWTLENWLVPGFPMPSERGQVNLGQLWFELGRLLGQVDRAGFIWTDICAKHVFAEPVTASGGSRSWRFSLIDLERASKWNARTRGGYGLSVPSWSVSFWHSLRPRRMSDLECAQFVDGCANGFLVEKARQLSAEDRGEPWLGWLQWMNEESPRLPDDYVHPRAERLYDEFGIRADICGRSKLIRAGIAKFDDAFNLSSAASLGKPGLQPHRDRLRLKSGKVESGGQALFVKRYRSPPLSEQIRRIREAQRDHSTAYREFMAARALLAQGAPTMSVVGFGESMQGWKEQLSFLATESIPGRSLEALALEWLADRSTMPCRVEKLDIIRQLALITRRMHLSCRYHRDLYLSHVFLTRNADGLIVLRLIDLARMVSASSRSRRWRWRIKDLAALAYSTPVELATRTDRLRFLRWYRDIPAHGQGDADRSPVQKRARMRRFMIDIDKRVRRMARHDKKRATRLGTSEPIGATSP